MRLVSGFIPETNNKANNKCLPRFVPTDNSSSSINTASNPKCFTTNIFTSKNVFRRKKQENGQFAITYAFNSKVSCCYKSFSSSKEMKILLLAVDGIYTAIKLNECSKGYHELFTNTCKRLCNMLWPLYKHVICFHYAKFTHVYL